MNASSPVILNNIVKDDRRALLRMYRWQCREVWRDGFFACKVASAALLHGIADRMECSSVSFLYYSMIFGHKTVVFR